MAPFRFHIIAAPAPFLCGCCPFCNTVYLGRTGHIDAEPLTEWTFPSLRIKQKPMVLMLPTHISIEWQNQTWLMSFLSLFWLNQQHPAYRCGAYRAAHQCRIDIFVFCHFDDYWHLDSLLQSSIYSHRPSHVICAHTCIDKCEFEFDITPSEASIIRKWMTSDNDVNKTTQRTCSNHPKPTDTCLHSSLYRFPYSINECNFNGVSWPFYEHKVYKHMRSTIDRTESETYLQFSRRWWNWAKCVSFQGVSIQFGEHV